MDCDGFVLSIKTQKLIIDLENLENLCDFSNTYNDHELFRKKNKKNVGKFKIGTPKNNWIDEFIAFVCKAYSFQCNISIVNKNYN